MPVRPCVLIVEDEPLIALDLQEAMLAVGFYVCGVAHAQAGARSLADSEHPDVILMVRSAPRRYGAAECCVPPTAALSRLHSPPN